MCPRCVDQSIIGDWRVLQNVRHHQPGRSSSQSNKSHQVRHLGEVPTWNDPPIMLHETRISQVSSSRTLEGGGLSISDNEDDQRTVWCSAPLQHYSPHLQTTLTWGFFINLRTGRFFIFSQR
ncbi:Histone demethylase JARID1B [Echinococcus multilocularis]|uniref:Histone demethylase JARID1B n=1 Tax=Echinococcus multilocularis TaxID=6211 RepID=A0A0S4MM16_ECHMU|nr:Histone demethylase JARID1B [Echinococcus multilocularis]